jgi:hypothetical protein
MKIIYLFRKTQHFKNRLKKRGGKLIYFLFSRFKKNLDSFDKTRGVAKVYKFRNHEFVLQDGIMQTYVNRKY